MKLLAFDDIFLSIKGVGVISFIQNEGKYHSHPPINEIMSLSAKSFIGVHFKVNVSYEDAPKLSFLT